VNIWLGDGGCEPGLTVTLDAGGRNRQGLGSCVEVEVDGRIQTRWMRTDTTASSSEAALFFGLGTDSSIDTLTVTWPDGGVTVLEDVEAGAPLHVVR
jgi:hypothetical protein